MPGFASLLPLIVLMSITAVPAAAGYEEDRKACTSLETDPDDGIAACTRLIEGKTGELAVFYSSRGDFWSEKDESDRAIADFDKAIEIDPAYAKAYGGRGGAFSDKGDFDRALADYDEAIRLDPKDPHHWNNRGLVWNHKDEFDRALADFDEAIRIDPAYTAAFANRGATYEARAEAKFNADIELAKAAYKAALALPQKYRSGKLAHETARERLDELTEDSRRTRAETSFEQDQKLCNSGETKPDEGIAACTRQIEAGRWKGHDLAISYYNRGIFWYDKDEYDEALTDYSKAIELSPDYSSAFNNRGLVWSAKGDSDRAIADYDQAIRFDSANPFTFNNRGLAWRRKGDHERALADFDQAIRIDSGYTAAYTNRGETYEAKGDIERARSEYRAALALPQKYGNGKWAHDKASERLAALAARAPGSLPPQHR